MPKFNFSENYKEAEKEYNLGRGEYFKMQEGANKVRLVSVCLPHASTYKGKPTFKWLCQVIDRADGKVKPFFMPITIYKDIEALQISDDYSFDDIPMPYDLTIMAKGAGTKEVNYSVLPGKEKELTAAEVKLVEEAPTVEELQAKLRENENKVDEPVEVDPSTVPF